MKHYEYWGWGDLDVFYGNLEETLGLSFGKFDYISTGLNGESGPLAFLRNSPKVNNLWKSIPDLHEKLNDSQGYAIDERAFLEILRANVSCDIVFRECLHDLPAVWKDGNLTSLRSGKSYALHHFGGHVGHSQKQITKVSHKIAKHLEGGGAFRIGRNFKIRRKFFLPGHLGGSD